MPRGKASESSKNSRQVRARSPVQRLASSEVTFHFIKSHLFRDIHVDGAFGGVAPSGRSIQMALYTERNPIPQKVVHSTNEIAQLGPEVRAKRESREGFVRDVEVNLVMDLRSAMSVRDWLSDKIEQLSGALADQRKLIVKAAEKEKKNG